MFNPNSTKAPYRSFPTHTTITPVAFITESNFALDDNNTLTRNLILQDNTELLVLEHGVGEKARWCKVKTGDEDVGYIIFSGSFGDTLIPLQNISPFYGLNTLRGYQPKSDEPPIDWKKQTINVPYADLNQGAYVVHCEMENVIEIGDKNSLINFMEQARIKGAKLILDSLGFKYTEQDFNKLITDYYLFCSAEEWYVDIRPCSTLRVAVVIPLRYLYAKTDLYKQDSPIETEDDTGLNEQDSAQGAAKQNPDLFVLSFQSYINYREYFDKLISTLGLYSLYYPTKLWTIQPEIGFSLLYEIDTLKNFVRETDSLIAKNHPNSVINDLNVGKILSGQENFGSASEKIWQNSLDIYISKSKKEIINIKYYKDSKRFSLNNGFNSYLLNESVKDKTLVNYLLNFNPVTDTFNPILEKRKESLDALTGSVSAVASSTGALEGIGNALEALNSTTFLLNPASLLTGDFIEPSMRNFLKKNHYPTIVNIFSKSLDLFECTIDSETRIRQLAEIRSPIEIEKWKQINATYERTKFKVEGDYFIRSIKEGLHLQDPNMRILLGIDTLPGKDPKEKLLTYISIAKTVDWTKFLGVAAQCLSQSIPIEDIMRLMKIYKEARKFIEQIFASSVCNPFLKNGLKVLNSFELPVIRAYNPNEALARELQTALYKILTDVASMAVKKALEAAAKACTSNPNQNFNGSNNAAAGAIPALNPNSQTNDPALNDLLDDIFSSLSGQSAPLGENQKQTAKLILQSIISDITSCLSLSELCALYKGEAVNDEVYQVIISLVKRKYGSPYSESFNTREQIINFFQTLGRNVDLAICPDIQDLQDGSTPNPFRNGNNILCDDGRVRVLREQILSDRGLTPDLIDESLNALKEEETKALEDILKLLNSDSPFDFSKVPDLGCKVFPSGETIAPSMQSFGAMLNSLTKTIYDTFDREAADWYTTTYSVSGTQNSLLKFDKDTGEITVNNQIANEAFDGQRKAILANKSSTAPTGPDDSGSDTGAEKNKLPSFIFKQTLKTANSAIKTSFIANNNIKYIESNAFLNGDLQQQLDINLVFNKLKLEIEKGELLLSEFAAKLWAQVLVKLTASTASAVAATSIKSAPSETISAFQPIIDLLYSLDIYLRKNVADNEELKYKLDEAYKILGVKDTQEASGFFAAENGAAIFLVICEQLKNSQTVRALNAVINLSSTNVTSQSELFINSSFSNETNLQKLLDRVLSQYTIVKDYYRTILNVKINYPDFDIKYQFGINKIVLPTVQNTFTGSTLTSYTNGKLYDIQKIETQKNKINHIKITEIREVSEQIQNFITGNIVGHTGSISGSLGITNLSTQDKKSLFFEYLNGKINYYNLIDSNSSTQKIASIDTSSLEAFSFSYEEIHQRIKNNLSQKIVSDSNKFLMLKRTKIKSNTEDRSINVMEQSGSGQPYTQYLKLVLPQTPQQKACKIRPHYLDIDTIKNGILEEKANNVCVEKAADQRTLGNNPISSEELKNLETSSTQDALLRGMYQLAIRIFLHDLLLRSISIFGVYDPQSFRDEPAFITFMAKMCESEMRGFDNDAFILLSEFLLKTYKKSNPQTKIRNEQIKKTELFRDLVEKELKTNVLPKLTKRIAQDTNLALVNNYPKDTTIKLVNLYDDIKNLDIFSVTKKAVYLKIYVQRTTIIQTNLGGGLSPTPSARDYINQKIYENKNALSDEQVINEFIGSSEFLFLFKYLFPVSQILNNLFIINCLATTTRKQIVNTFRGTKYDALSTCKIIQANGQQIAPNPNNPQALATDPMEIIIGFLLQAVIKTPISILKGIAEISEPNLALVSTLFKVVRAFVPKLSSVMIPLTSIPLGLLPTPLTPVLPFMNPLLAGAYFATLAWFDDKPLDEVLQLQKESQENNLFNSIVCDDVLNQDLFYNDEKTPIQQGLYELNKQKIDDPIIKDAIPAIDVSTTREQTDTTGSTIQGSTTQGSTTQGSTTQNLRQQAILTIIQAVKETPYTYTQESGANRDGDSIEQTFTKKIILLIPSKITLTKIRELVNSEVEAVESINGFTLSPSYSSFNTLKTQCINLVKNYLNRNIA